MALIVWDYHGTLVKGNEHAVRELSNMGLAAEGFSQRFTEEHTRLLYGKRWIQFFEALLPDEPSSVHQRLQRTTLAIDKAHPGVRVQYIRPADHSHEVLTELGRAHRQVLISNCHDITVFLRLTDMERYFPPGHRFATAATTPVKSKQELLDGYRQGRRELTLLVGDSPEDISLNPGDVTVLYANPGIPFRVCPADYTIRDLRDVPRILKESERRASLSPSLRLF